MPRTHRSYSPADIDIMQKYEQRIDNRHYFRCHANRAAAKALGRSEKAIASYKYAHQDLFPIVSPRMQELARLRYSLPRPDAAQQALDFDALQTAAPSTAKTIRRITLNTKVVLEGTAEDIAQIVSLLL